MSGHRVVTILFLVLLAGMLLLKEPLSLSAYWIFLLVAAYVAITTYGASVLSMQYFLHAHTAGSRASNTIALTFDDGPVAGKTDQILDILRQHNVAGTFFCIGSKAVESPALLNRINDEGHLIGNHSYHHGKMFDLLPSGSMLEELKSTDAIVKKTIGFSPRFFRPPYGVTNPLVAKAVKRGNYQVVGWSIRSFDTVIKDQRRLLTRITKNVKGGDIVLLHDHSESMIAVLPDFIEMTKKAGLKIVRLDVLLNEKGYVEN